MMFLMKRYEIHLLKNNLKPWFKVYGDGVRFGVGRIQFLVGGKSKLGIWWLKKNNTLWTIVDFGYKPN
jgi:hypothetical protein